MSRFLRGNRYLIKDMNRSLLLNIIRREGRISRKQLTEVSGLSMGSVSGIVTDLLENDWILEVGEGDYTGGRRQTFIKLNPEVGYAVGLKLMESRVVVAITNFEADIIAYKEETYTFNPDPETLVRTLSSIIRRVLEESQIEPETLFGVGIGLAGVVYSNSGIVHHSPFFGWKDIPLAMLIEQEINYPVYIENDVNALTLTEQLFGTGRHYNNFVVVTIGRGIGMGLVINNQLYRGVRGGAGELGHTVLIQQTNNHDEFDFKTLEDSASDPALINHLFRQGHVPEISELDDIIKLADEGDEVAQEELRRSGQLLGIGLANIINVLNPELIIISGEGTIAGDYRLQPMLESMKKFTFNGLLDDVKVVIEPTNDRAWARGAASLVINKVFESPIEEAQSNT